MNFLQHQVGEPTIYLYLKVKTNAKENAFEQPVKIGDVEYLGLRIKALPIDGKANKEIINFLAKTLGLKKSMITIVKGEASNLKKIALSTNDINILKQKIIFNTRISE